ncbi:GNAT family N-acetyltransferase [Ramlibacter henchirensis]|uniref:GNAT family N-acetyltransferase n=1 Tax=Ramlibacter henchirensis TaxID=204072 RepID=A0A4Z0BU70_9BURK|nr:GNAT family N-acetyltransferase [Ramlibacter henchirensis]TFZ02391.1 GNAT family N-acetyltransferase [Ramlibacter henchirensis]
MAVLDNVFWHALSDTQRHLTLGTGNVRRYSSGLPPLLAFADPRHPHLDELAPFCAPGERFYAADWRGDAPPGWQIELETTMELMVWSGGAVSEEPIEAVRLGADHVEHMVELATLTKPGPFGPRNLELGTYLGCFEQGRLAAMAGERTQAGALREVSAIATHPDFQGRGLARKLVKRIVANQLARGETPFLHVMSSNAGALHLYRQLGFEVYRTCAVRVVAKT